MAIHLLDVNILLALAWPNHDHHAFVGEWFLRNASSGWATSPLTQCSFVRISSNPRILPFGTTPANAIDVLRRITADASHVFWTDDLPMTDFAYTPISRLVGHQQITDAHLFALCLSRGGRLATMDRGIISLCRNPTERAAVELLEPPAPAP